MYGRKKSASFEFQSLRAEKEGLEWDRVGHDALIRVDGVRNRGKYSLYCLNLLFKLCVTVVYLDFLKICAITDLTDQTWTFRPISDSAEPPIFMDQSL